MKRKLFQILKSQNLHWQNIYEQDQASVRIRYLDQLLANVGTKAPILISGQLGVGKSTLLQQFINYLQTNKKIEPTAIFKIDLTDIRLEGATLIDMVDCYRNNHLIEANEFAYLVIDEIWKLPAWQTQIDQVAQTNRLKIIFTSSLKIDCRLEDLKKIELKPLDFEEYLTLHKITLSQQNYHLAPQYFENFLRSGGLLGASNGNNLNIYLKVLNQQLGEYFAIYKSVKKLQLVKQFCLYLYQHPTGNVSINQMAKIFACPPDTARRIYNMLNESKLFIFVKRFAAKNGAKFMLPADHGFLNLGVEFNNSRALLIHLVNYFSEHQLAIKLQSGKIILLVDDSQILIDLEDAEDKKNTADFVIKTYTDYSRLLDYFNNLKK